MKGFSLVEMSIIMIFIAVMISHPLQTISHHMEMEMRSKTKIVLKDLEDAAIGYAATHQRLPITIEELGEPFYDAWGRKIVYTPATEYLTAITPTTQSSLCVPKESTDCSIVDRNKNLYVAAMFTASDELYGYITEKSIQWYLVRTPNY